MDGARDEAGSGLGFLRQIFGDRSAAPAAAASGDCVADAAILALRRHGIRPTPEAFTIWYRHLAGERPDLSRRLRDLEARGERFDATLIAELHERYVGIDPALRQADLATRNTERLLARLQDDLEVVEQDAAARGSRLGRLGEALAAGEAAEEAVGEAASRARLEERYRQMRGLLEELARETAEMHRAAGRLQHRVIEGAAEIAQLRAALAEVEDRDEIDPVSGVPNFRAFERRLRRKAAAAEAGEGALSLIIVDPDRFGDFNTANGRRLGDLMLRAMASLLARAIGEAGCVGRLEGALFGILLPGTLLATAVEIAERLVPAIAALRLDTGEAGAAVPPVTASAGVAEWHPGEPLKRFVGRAEHARRSAREAGGNRVVSERSITVVGRPKA